MLAILDALTTGAAWDLMRAQQGLSVRDVRQAMTDAVIAVLEVPA